MTDLAQDLARHAAGFSSSALGEDDVEHVVRSLIDAVAAIVGGSGSDGLAETRTWALSIYQPGPARVLSTPHKLVDVAAAQLNATAGHALDFDDTLDEGGGMHAGALVHSVALALSDTLGTVSGADYVAAVAVGLDVAVRLALAPTEDFGWHRTAAFGIFGATVTAGRLLGLNETQFIHALGLAYSQASGNRQCIPDSALSKRLQAGFAARDAITAARLAQSGVTAATRIFEGLDGFFNLYQRGAFARDVVLDALGTELRHKRISLKPYPCGRGLHGLLDAALNARHPGEPDRIAGASIHVTRRDYDRANRGYPVQVVDAQFSHAFAVALLLATGETPLSDFARPEQASHAVKSLFDRIELVADEARAGTLVLRYADGSEQVEKAPAIRSGHPANPLTSDRLERKLLDCYRFRDEAVEPGKVRDIFRLLSTLPSLDNVGALTDRL